MSPATIWKLDFGFTIERAQIQGRIQMIEVAIMIEAQNGLNWPRWKRIIRAVEELGFVGLYRSDHFTNMNPPDKDSLEL